MGPTMTRYGTVLVVDDDAEIREVLIHLLEQEGYTVLGAENGLQALVQLRESQPNLMLLDLMMPVMSGWEVLEALAETGELARIPVIVVSAMCAPGAQACLRKPVDLDELLALVGRYCHEATAPAEATGAPHH
jgi:two-component system response regulator CpxR